MMHNKNMKNILIITFLCLFCAQTAFAVPNYNPNQKPNYYHAPETAAYLNKLKKQYDKKHIIKETENLVVYDDIVFTYHNEVTIPYCEYLEKIQDQK